MQCGQRNVIDYCTHAVFINETTAFTAGAINTGVYLVSAMLIHAEWLSRYASGVIILRHAMYKWPLMRSQVHITSQEVTD